MARGRPRAFDRDEALHTAMDVFWRRGYQAASISVLAQEMGIGSPSLYAAFGSKAQLFCEAADLYRRAEGAAADHALAHGGTARESVAAMLRANVELFTPVDGPRGCLLTRATATAGDDATVQAYLREVARERVAAVEARLAQARRDGEWLPTTDERALAEYVDVVLQGLAVRASEGAPRSALLAAVDRAMRVWDAPDRG